MIDESTKRRFLAKIAVDDQDKCWPWRHAIASTGYGIINCKRKSTGAHKVSYEVFKGPIPDGLWVLHNCPGGDRRSCVNPAHLWAGTQLDNIADATKKGQVPSGDAHWTRAGVKPAVPKHPRIPKFKQEDIPKLFEAQKRGLTQRQIAALFNLSQQWVCTLMKRNRPV